VLVATDGEANVAAPGISARATSTARRSETVAACAALGVSLPSFLGLPDGSLCNEIAALARGISEIVDNFDPEAVFVPWPLDGHPDHRATALAVALVPLRGGVEVWGYEVWSPLPANRLVDVTAGWDAKVRALACHTTAHSTFDTSAHLALSRWRSFFGLDGQGHAEAFLVLDAASWRASVGDSERD
jgi:LmbE family N-acetylglucosaminyl deacetylase